MKKIYFFLSLALTVLVTTSCSNEEILDQQVNTEEELSDADIASIQNFGKNFISFNKSFMPIMEKRTARMKAGRNTPQNNQQDMAAIQQQVEQLGEDAQQMLMELGFTEEELNEMCPLDEKEIYAFVGMQILASAAGPNTDFWNDENDDEEEQIDFPHLIRVSTKCLMEVLDLDVIEDIFAGYHAGQTITKKFIKETCEKFIKRTVIKMGKYAAGGTVGAAVFVAEWGYCVFKNY